MIYLYQCKGCGMEAQDETFCKLGEFLPRVSCAVCGGRLVRTVGRVSVVKGMEMGFQPHFNNTVGEPVTSLHDFKEKLAAKARAQTEATGIEHTYAMTDPRDSEAHGVTAEGIAINEAVNRGERPVDSALTPMPESEVQTGEAPPLVGEKT